MRKIAILFAWWFLVQGPGNSNTFTQVGPFDSEAMCKAIAGWTQSGAVWRGYPSACWEAKAQ